MSINSEEFLLTSDLTIINFSKVYFLIIDKKIDIRYKYKIKWFLYDKGYLDILNFWHVLNSK